MKSYENYQYLKFDRPSERVLRITINRPEKLNSLPWEAHGELARVWLDVDKDKETNVAIIWVILVWSKKLSMTMKCR
jgi:enoyl-CoA hydratase